jgi:hypothetical protein
MILSVFLSLLARDPGFTWRPALDLSDGRVYSTLIAGTQY